MGPGGWRGGVGGDGGELGAGHWIVTRSRADVERQANAALDALEAANGGVMPPTLRAAYDVDPAAFARLIEALVWLGADVDLDLQQLAGMRPIGEVL